MTRTDELIAGLAAEGAVPAGARTPVRLAGAALAGICAAAFGAALLGVRADVAALAPDGATLGKMGAGTLVALGAAALAGRLAAPGRGAGAAFAALVLAVVALAAFGAGAPLAPASMGLTCAASIVLLGLPGLAGALWAVRGRPVLRPGAAGAAAGLLAAATGLTGFAVHCPAGAVAPMLGWYALAGLALAGIGALSAVRAVRPVR